MNLDLMRFAMKLNDLVWIALDSRMVFLESRYFIYMILNKEYCVQKCIRVGCIDASAIARHCRLSRPEIWLMRPNSWTCQNGKQAVADAHSFL